MSKRSFFTILFTMWYFSVSSQGLKLFNPKMKEAVSKTQSVVMDFLERYFDELSSIKQTTIQTKMADDKVYFRNGKPSDLSQVCDSMPFTISLFDRYYEVSWSKAEEAFITIVFPAQYDLLLGMQQNEAQQKFKNIVISSTNRKVIASTPTNLVAVDNSIYISKNECFELESLTDATYYYNEGKLIFDNDHLEQSAANLFHGLIHDTDYRMYVEQSVYGMKTIYYTLTLNQWLNYCAEWGLKIFFAIEEEREDGLLALVIAQSKELGFHHLLSVIIPDKFVSDKNTVLKVRMTPYIPIHNVKNLYQELSSTHN